VKITDYLQVGNIFLNVHLENKQAVLKYVADVRVDNHIVNDSGLLYKGLNQREETMSTGVGGGLAFPHTTSAEARQANVVLIRLESPIDFDSLDNQKVDIILALIIPAADPTIHVRLLARVARLCKNPEFITAIKKADAADLLLDRIRILEDETSF